MEIGQILYDLTHRTTLPVAALRAAAERRDEVVPVFLDILRRYIEGDREARQEPSPLSLIFHLLGQFREKSAYPLMTRLLRIDSEDLENLLRDAVTETVHRVIANVFDGNLQPIYDVIEDPDANVYVRSRMLETLALLVHTGAADKAEVERYLREIDQRLPPPDDDFVWIGW